MKVNITNFKCHENLFMELKKFNIVSGKNSSGKSSIIDALDIYFNYENELYLREVNGSDYIGFVELLNNNSSTGQFSISVDDYMLIFDEMLSNHGSLNDYSKVVGDKVDYNFMRIPANRTIKLPQFTKEMSSNYYPSRTNETLLSYLYYRYNDGSNITWLSEISSVLKRIGIIKEKIEIEKIGDQLIMLVDVDRLHYSGQKR